jgi:polyphosphate kinase
VQVDLIVRGMCSLRPGLAGTSERIRVSSIVDRYLEHARIFYFQNGGSPNCWLASADWMQRNFDRRVEIAFPIIDPQLQAGLKQILEIQLGDTVKAWAMQPDGTYARNRNDGSSSVRCQERLYEIIQSENGTAAAARASRVD